MEMPDGETAANGMHAIRGGYTHADAAVYHNEIGLGRNPPYPSAEKSCL